MQSIKKCFLLTLLACKKPKHMLYQLSDHNQNLPSKDTYTCHRVGLRSYKYLRVLTYLPSHNIPE